MGITVKQTIPSNFGEGGIGISPDGSGAVPDLKTILWGMVDRVHAPVATRAALDLIGATSTTSLDRVDGMACLVRADNSTWVFDAANTTAGTADVTGDLLRVPFDAPAAGRWLRLDEVVELKLPVGFGTADAAILWTVPAGFRVSVAPSSFWEVTTTFAGGSSSAIGLSSSNAGASTKGDLLGGAGGDVAATLVSTGAFAKGTVGAKTGKPAATLVAGDTIRFDRIASIFTSGTGFAHVQLLVP